MSEYARYVTEDELRADLTSLGKPVAYNTDEGYPFTRLTDRQFECLLHDLAISHQSRPNNPFGTYDRAALMQGVGERGRDCALISNEKHVGAIQCKQHQGLITRPDAAREIIKYCLHALKDPELMPQPTGFRYVFAASKDFNEKAKALLNAFGSKIAHEEDLHDWASEVVEGYEGFADLDLSQTMPRLLAILTSITVVPLGFNELNTMLVTENGLIAKYFSVRTVVDDAHIKELKDQVSQIAQSLTDPDTRRLIDDLNAQPKDRRLDLGIFSLWGYPRRFVENLFRMGKLKQVGMQLSMAKAEVDVLFMDQLLELAHEEIFSKITQTKVVSPLVTAAAIPYLNGRLLDRWRSKQHGAALSAILPRPAIQTDAVSIRKRILDRGQEFLNDDWSGYAGDAGTLSLKKRLAEHAYGGYADVSEMGRAFDAEWPTLEPVLRVIETKLEAELPTETIIVLRSMQWWDDESHVKNVVSTMVDLETKESEGAGSLRADRD